MHSALHVALLLGAVVTAPHAVAAQRAPGATAAAVPDSVPVAPGQRVRFYVAPPGAWRAGVVARVSRDSLWLAPPAVGGGVGVALADLWALDVARRGRGSQTRHVLVGAAGGAVAGALAGVAAAQECYHRRNEGNCDIEVGFRAAYGGGGGLVVGAIAGGFFPSGPRWQRVLPRPSAP